MMKAIVLIPTRERKMKCTQFFPTRPLLTKWHIRCLKPKAQIEKKTLAIQY